MTSQDFKKKLISILQDNGCVVKFYDPNGINPFNNNRVVIDTNDPNSFIVMSPFKNYYVEFHADDSDEEFNKKIKDYKAEVKKSFLDAFNNRYLQINLDITTGLFFDCIVRLLDCDDAIAEYDRVLIKSKGDIYSYNHINTSAIIRALLR